MIFHALNYLFKYRKNNYSKQKGTR